MQTGINMGFQCIEFLDCMSIHCEVIWNIVMSSNFLNTLYVSQLPRCPFEWVIECAIVMGQNVRNMYCLPSSDFEGYENIDYDQAVSEGLNNYK